MSEAKKERLYQPEPGEAQLTVRAVITGCCLGGVVASMNIYFGLKTGWAIGGSLIAAILGFAIWTALRVMFAVRPFTPLETNITQTTGSAAGSMAGAAGLLSSIPALGLLGTTLSWWELMIWALSIGYLGVFFAVPLRNQMVVVEKLRFPTGMATAETIVSMFAEGKQAIAQARALLLWGVISGVFTLIVFFVPQLGHPPMDWLADSLGRLGWSALAGAVTAMGAWGFSLLISPLMLGAGILIGPRVGSSLLVGTIVAWGMLGPFVMHQGWTEDQSIMSYMTGPRGWILWPGVAIMVSDAFANLLLSWRSVLNTFRRPKRRAAPEHSDGEEDESGMEDVSERVPNSWWIIGLGLGSVLTCTVSQLVFGIPVWLTLIAIAMSSVLAMIAVRSVGETDINPTGGMGKVTQLAFGGLAPGNTTTNLMAAGITSAGASQAGDMMQDLKTGYLLGASPKRQIIAQCIGIAAGVPIAVGVYLLFDAAWEIGVDERIPAPAAQAWRAMAELLSKGLHELPTHAASAVLGGCIFGLLIPIIRKKVKVLAPYMPSGLAFGIAFIVPAYYSISMFIGSMFLVLWKRRAPKSAAVFAIAVASGLIAGEGLMGVVTAVLTLLGLQPIT